MNLKFHVSVLLLTYKYRFLPFGKETNGFENLQMGTKVYNSSPLFAVLTL
jgi:hypothetical protein